MGYILERCKERFSDIKEVTAVPDLYIDIPNCDNDAQGENPIGDILMYPVGTKIEKIKRVGNARDKITHIGRDEEFERGLAKIIKRRKA